MPIRWDRSRWSRAVRGSRDFDRRVDEYIEFYALVMTIDLAPPLDVSEWVNSTGERLDDLRGRVVVVEAFQMLCPGCVSHGLPQALRIHQSFSREHVVVLGLHTVFEHHDVMGPDALRVFLSEQRIDFPVGVDRHDQPHSIPATMKAYELQGTPSLLLIDRAGRLRRRYFGAMDDLVVGAQIGMLIAEPAPSVPESSRVAAESQ